MSAVLTAADLRLLDLPDLLRELQPPTEERLRLWLEAADGCTLDWWPGLHGTLLWYEAGHLPRATDGVAAMLLRSVSARLFAPSGELRWRVLPVLGEYCCRTVFLGSYDWLSDPRFTRTTALAGLQRGTANYLLWGQQTLGTPGEWIELRIPHRFRYPIDETAPRVKAEVETWADAAGEIQFQRLVSLNAFDEA